MRGMAKHIGLLTLLCLCGISLPAQVQYPDNIVPADCADLPLASSWNIEQGAVSQPLSHMYAQPFIGDIDGDGLSEIVTAGFYTSPSVSNSIVIYGHNLQLKYSFNTGDMYVYGGYPLAVADVDGDGTAEIFIQNRDGHLRCYHPNGNLLWSSYVTSESNRSPNLIIADVNRDGIPEIMSLDKILNAVSGTVILSLPETIGCSSIYAGNSGHSAMPVFADFDNDGILEAAGGDKVYKLDISNSAGPSGNSAVLWKTISGSGTGDGLTSVADIDLDGFLDVVVVRSGHMFAWKPYSGTGSSPALIGSCPYTSTTAGSRALLTDVNNNGHPEILFTYAANIVAYQYLAASQSLQLMWQKSTSDLSGATTMTAFDFNQDGSVEIVFRDQSDLRIIDGTTGNNKSDIPCIAPTATENPAVADLDLDGEAEIIVSSSTYDSNQDKHAKLIVFKSPANASWAPARHVWNQHAYNVVNINDDLTVPTDNFNPATTFTDPQGVVRRPFNNFLQQATTLDQYGRPFMPLANVTIDGQPQVTIEGGAMTLDLTVCNTGDVAFAAPLYISLYTHLGECVQTDEFPQSLQPGECATLQLAYDLNRLKNFDDPYPLHLAVNDNGQGTAQHGGLQAECDTTDNHFRFDGRPCTITLPNVITPNGDSFNDAFIPQLEGDFLSLKMEIYNRWGKRVYQQENSDSLCWDAEGVSDGVFYCAIDYYCATSGKKRQHANTSVTVVR